MENNCEPCEVNNKHKLSIKWCVICEESLCEECTENHRAMKMSRDHHLVDINERAKHTGISSQGCEKHENMLFEYFCVNHDTLCCKECLAMTHRMCEKVVSIDMAAKGSKHSQPFLDSVELVKHVLDTTSNLRNHLKENFQSTENDEKHVRKGVQAHIASLEKSMMEDLEYAKKQCIDTIDKKMNEAENIEKQVKDQIETYALVEKYGTDTQAFILIHSSKKILTDIENQTKDLTESTTVNSLSLSESSSNSIGSLRIGLVEIIETPCKIKFDPPKKLQPQIPVEKN
ncbi:transcription intermediary factor 1-beta-like [Mytilus edulis]|uniref:transcription intermediary factor 1-beta-like n=1 Tax=Mytilus edulis TaxID=6550 RepID=UPI0039F11C29